MLKLLFKLGANHRKGMIFISKPFPSNSQVFTYLWSIFSHIHIYQLDVPLFYFHILITLYICLYNPQKNYYLHTTVWIQIKHPDYCVDYSMIKKSNFPVCIHICHSRFLFTLTIIINFLLVWMILWHISFLCCVYPGLNRNHWWQWKFFVYVEVKIEEHLIRIGIDIDKNNVWHL